MIHRNIEILPAGTNRGKPDKCRLDSADPANKPRSAQLNARNQFVLINQFCKTKQPQCLDPLEGEIIKTVAVTPEPLCCGLSQ